MGIERIKKGIEEDVKNVLYGLSNPDTEFVTLSLVSVTNNPLFPDVQNATVHELIDGQKLHAFVPPDMFATGDSVEVRKESGFKIPLPTLFIQDPKPENFYIKKRHLDRQLNKRGRLYLALPRKNE